jgi:Tol biopolymer transport system component
MRKAITVILTGGSFLLVMGTAGCSSFRSMLPWNHSHLATKAPVADEHQATQFATHESEMLGDVPAPAVNVFGEMDGVAPTAVAHGSDSAFQQHTFADEGYDNDVAVSPDGKWLVFTSTRHNEHPDIYLQKVDGQSVTQLTSDMTDDVFPTFSPDGKTIAFCSTRSGNWDIYTTDLDGKNVTQVTSGPAQDLHPSFSPDGSRLAYCSSAGRSGQWELWIVNLQSNEKRMIGTGLFPRWSPNKSRDQIAFQRARQRGSRWFSLWTMDLVDGEARHVTEVAVSTNAAVVSPAWSPDGSKLAFGTIVDPARNVNGKPPGQQDVWTVDADGSNRRRITDGAGANTGPCWANDGRIFFVSDRGGTECIWSARAEQPRTMTAAKESKQSVGSVDTHEAAP